jgi:apolipoprotein N-acyltransferase
MNKYTLTGLSVISGILTGLAWTSYCSGLILLISFVPLFLIENHLFERRNRYSPNAYFIFLLPGFVIFSIIALGWMRVASMIGAICVIMGLSFLMAFSLWLAHLVRLRSGNIAGIISMIAFWLAYELLSLNINIVSPWLNLGNGLAKDILFIQWYEFTGTAGGTLWILLSNLLLSIILTRYLNVRKNRPGYLITWLLIITVPIIFSFYRYFSIKEDNTHRAKVVIIQPNTDPYTEKFTIPFEDQLQKVINLANTEITNRTDWIITPETTVDDPADLNNLASDKYVNLIKEMIKPYPRINVVTGLVTYKIYPASVNAPTVSARKIDASGRYYDHFNSAILIGSSNAFGIYHKSKLVPGIEMQFSNGPGRFLTKILPSLGGTKWGYGIQEERTCFRHSETSMQVAPIICYESVFGKFVTDYVRNGAEALFIITNDGWWKSTSGYKQHLNFASLRAIETRREIARCGNTGVSCFIDTRGKRTEETEWWTKAVLKGNISRETRITVYVKYGDYILWISLFLSGLILFLVFLINPLRKKILLVKE